MELKPTRRPKMSSGEVVFWVLCLLAAPAAGQVRVSTIQEAIERWTPETHVYVMGDVGLEPDALAEMESSLADGHWTVLLVQDATGQRFQDDDGVTREGVDAIEWGTGQGMARAAGFESQTHPKTGEPDGTILSIVLAQRALCYTGSKAQDGRGLGDEAFAGNLDRWAIEAMRNGGDVASAVRNTVTNVDNLLASVIEQGPREDREAILTAEQSLKDLDRAAAALRDSPSHPSGSLANPDTRSILEDLDRARAQAETEPEVARRRSLGVVAAAFLILLLLGLNRRRAGVKEEAEDLLDSWQAALDRKQEALLGGLEPRVAAIVGPVSAADRQGETLELAESVRTDVGALIILCASAGAVLEKARGHIRPQRTSDRFANLFLVRHYRKGIALLRDEPVPFDPAEGLPRLGAGRGWREDLLGGLASYEPFRKSFQELTAELDARAERATLGLDDLETAFTRLPELQQAIQDRARLVPVAQAALEQARETLGDDPVRSLRETRRATRAVELFERLPQVRSEIAAGENRIEAARRELGALLGLDPWSLLREEGQAPSERLAGAARQADAARAALDSGHLDDAGAALEQAAQLTLEASALVDRSLEAARSWEKEVRERSAETERLAGLLPEHQALAARMRERFGTSDETLRSGGLEAARGEIGVGRHNLEAAAAAIREGRVLAAAELLRKAGAHQERAAGCLAEIRNELDRLVEEALAAELARRQREEDEERSERRRAAQSLLGSSSSSRSSSSSGGSSGSSGSSSGSGRSSWGGSRSGSGRSGW